MKKWIEPFVWVIALCAITLAIVNIVNYNDTARKCDFITTLGRLQREVDRSLPGDRDGLVRMTAEYNCRLAVYKSHGDMRDVPFIDYDMLPRQGARTK